MLSRFWCAAVVGGDLFVMPDHFLMTKFRNFSAKSGSRCASVGQLAKARDLLLLARRVGRRQTVLGLEHADRLGAAEALGQHVDQRRVDIVDRGAVVGKLRA